MWFRVLLVMAALFLIGTRAEAQSGEDADIAQGYGSMMAISLASECGSPLTEHGRSKAELFSYVHFAKQGLSPAQAALEVSKLTTWLRQEWPRTPKDKKAETCRLLKEIAAGLNRVGE